LPIPPANRNDDSIKSLRAILLLVAACPAGSAAMLRQHK
jgi:hypothetical protein